MALLLEKSTENAFSHACGYNVQVQEIVKALYGEQIQRIEKCGLCSTTHDERNQALHEEHAHRDHTYTHLYIEMARIITIITQLRLLLVQQIPLQTLIYMIFIIMINGDISYLGLDDCCYPPSSMIRSGEVLMRLSLEM
ncbi:hypothetical protein NC653_029630 [Populus alba x Populus x berolinensis]|uniref:Uncharacterized protein n=1 Tax=Populus alba x Populus x berolinensis TaxID=444605 RepID=A0AAD6M309_9ROSI|nr:hypothetical protein NC653_029630 [Populus alba x Populus x berolinensis]